MSQTLRKATPADIPFLVEAVVASESAGVKPAVPLYQKMFKLSKEETDSLIFNALGQSGAGYQLSYQTFYILERNNIQLATCSAWLEAADGVTSAFKVAASLLYHLGEEKWMRARQELKALAKGAVVRTRGTLQLDAFFTAEVFRGQGLVSELISQVVDFCMEKDRFECIEIVLVDGNTSALKAYQKAGFQIHARTNPQDEQFTYLTGGPGFVVLKKYCG